MHFPVIVTITTAMFTPKARPSALALRCGTFAQQLICSFGGSSEALSVICSTGTSSQLRISCICLPAWKSLLLLVEVHWLEATLPSILAGCLPVKAASDDGLWGTQGWLHCILYVLFENAMGIVKLWACVAGACHPLSSLA